MNTTVSANQNTSEERRYNIRSWLTRGKEDEEVNKKRDLGHTGFERVAGTRRVGFRDREGLKWRLQNRYFLDLLGKNEMIGLAELQENRKI
jgi:hypothetical protein